MTSRRDHALLEDEHVTIHEVHEHEASPSRPATKHIGRIEIAEPAEYARKLLPKAVDYGCAMTDRSFCILVDVEGLALIIITDGALTLELAPSKDALRRLVQDTHTECVRLGWIDRRVRRRMDMASQDLQEKFYNSNHLCPISIERERAILLHHFREVANHCGAQAVGLTRAFLDGRGDMQLGEMMAAHHIMSQICQYASTALLRRHRAEPKIGSITAHDFDLAAAAMVPAMTLLSSSVVRGLKRLAEVSVVGCAQTQRGVMIASSAGLVNQLIRRNLPKSSPYAMVYMSCCGKPRRPRRGNPAWMPNCHILLDNPRFGSLDAYTRIGVESESLEICTSSRFGGCLNPQCFGSPNDLGIVRARVLGHSHGSAGIRFMNDDGHTDVSFFFTSLVEPYDPELGTRSMFDVAEGFMESYARLCGEIREHLDAIAYLHELACG